MSASQQSSLTLGADEASMVGSLASDSPSEPPLGNTTGDAVFDITFDVDAGASFAWSGAGTISGGGYGGAFLHDLTADTILFEASLPTERSERGDLLAGPRYRILHHATTLGLGSASWEFDFSATAPEPDAAASLAAGLGLVALLARRRRAPRRS